MGFDVTRESYKQQGIPNTHAFVEVQFNELAAFSRPQMETESRFAKSYQVLPSVSVMTDELDNILAARKHLENSLEQSSCSQLMDIRTGSMNSSENFRVFNENISVVRLKRTARALASQSASDDENFVTSDKLPSVASPLVLSVGTSQTKLQAMPAMAPPARRRNLLPAPKTSMMPASSPTELRAIIRESHSKRQEQISVRKTRQGMSSCRSKQQARTKSGFWTNVKEVFAAPMRQLSNLLDQLALA